MQDLFTLGNLYVSDFIKAGEQNRAGRHELALVLTDEGFVRLKTTVPVEKMFGKYFYRSGLNATMKTELKDVVDSILKTYKSNISTSLKEMLKSTEDIWPLVWLDIASNDGTLLSYVPAEFYSIGADPADDTYKVEAEKHAELIIQDFFSAKVYKESGKAKPAVITCCAMFYDLEYPEVFLNDIQEVLDDNGLFVVQMSYTPTMLTGLQFDNILAEHIFYNSLSSIKKLFEKCDFKILDCQLNSCNGGSFRVFAMKKNGNEKLFGDQAFRDIAKIRLTSLLEYEKTLKLDQAETWFKFKSDIDDLKENTVSFIRQVRKEGKRVMGIGASTKSGTLVQYFGLTSNDLEAIVERNPDKVGLYPAGIDIKIISEEEFRSNPPDYVLVLIWPFINELIERESEYLKHGAFIVPCPKFEIISG